MCYMFFSFSFEHTYDTYPVMRHSSKSPCRLSPKVSRTTNHTYLWTYDMEESVIQDSIQPYARKDLPPNGAHRTYRDNNNNARTRSFPTFGLFKLRFRSSLGVEYSSSYHPMRHTESLLV